MKTEIFSVGEKTATIYCSKYENRPLIVLNTYSGNGNSVSEALKYLNAPDCNLLVVGNLNWDHDMTPWYCPALSENDTPCTGGADAYLQLLLTEILPKAQLLIKGTPSHISIAGYSLAGLFALYAMYKTDVFDNAASMSGSLWFPGFKEYIFNHSMPKKPNKIYLSLGDKESKTKHPLLKTVQENTEAAAQHYKKLAYEVTFEMNAGNHFKDAALRSAKGIAAII